MKFGILLSLVMFFFLASAQEKIRIAPANPDYLEYLQEIESGFKGFAAPSPAVLNYQAYYNLKESKAPGDYPVVFDLRTAGPGGSSLLTPVKHQLSCGACWTFSTFSSIESVWMMQGLGEWDLSENNLKNCHGFDLNPCQWGHHFMSTAYLVRGSGPILEEDDPYDPEDNTCIGETTPQAYIPEAWYLPEDHDAFKDVIMNHGAVYNTFKSVSASYEWINGHLTYCYQGSGTTSHAVAIVGWNDTLTTGCGQGAWICKDQYGVSHGEDGYFYMAYQDTLVLKYNAIWPEREDYDSDVKIYQYDTVGGWPFVGYEDSIAYGLVKFQAASDQFITRVGTYTVSYGTSLTAEVYTNFDGTELSNLVAVSEETYFEYPGYYTLELEQAFRVIAGEDYYVKIKYNSPEFGFPIAAEGFDNGYTSPHIETGKCWSREEGGPWEAWGDDTSFKYDICIKAYGRNTTELDLNVFLEGPFLIDEMHNELVQEPDFPTIQPYNAAPWNYQGTETLLEIPETAVDWLLVELRETPGSAADATASTVVRRFAAILLADGSIVDTDGVSNPGLNLDIQENLFVVIYHRNHLPVLSANPLQKSGAVYTYNFTDDVTQFYGGFEGCKELASGIYGMISGDGTANGMVDDADLLLWQESAGQKGYIKSDMNLDRQTDNRDKNDLLVPNSGSNSQVPD